MQADQRSTRLGLIYGGITALLFAAYVLINRYVYITYHVDPWSYTVTFALASAVFAAGSLAMYKQRQAIKVLRVGTLPVIGVSILASVAIGLVVFGQNYTTAVNASIIATATIITTNAFSVLILKESFRSSQKLWLVVMFAGLYLGIVGLHLLRLNVGDAIILAAGVIFGFTNTASKVLMKSRSSDFVADARLITGGIMLGLAGFVTLGPDMLVTTAGWWPLVAGLCFWLTVKLFYLTIHYLSANRAIVVTNSHLFFTAIVGVLVLGELYSWEKFVGSVMVLVSVYFISKSPRT